MVNYSLVQDLREYFSLLFTVSFLCGLNPLSPCLARATINRKFQENLDSDALFCSMLLILCFVFQLERAADGFSVVAEYYGRGVFNKVGISMLY